MPRISLDKRVQIVQLIQRGESQRCVSRSLGVSRCAIQAIYKKFVDTGSVENKVKMGRPQRTSLREKRTLIRLSRQNPFLSAVQLKNNWKTEHSVSTSTVKRILRKYGLLGRIAAKKPLLNKKHKADRLKWCRDHLHWNHDNFKRLIYSDECKIELFRNKRVYVRRVKGSRFNERYTQKTVKFGGKSLMVWGAVKATGERSLVQCLPRMNASEYQRVLACGLKEIYKRNDILVQDGAPCHTAKSTSNFLRTQKITVMNNWPAQSPDLNIIENLWSILKRSVSQMPAKTINDLWNNCLHVWNNIPNQTIENLFFSIPSRIRSVIHNMGSHTRY